MDRDTGWTREESHCVVLFWAVHSAPTVQVTGCCAGSSDVRCVGEGQTAVLSTSSVTPISWSSVVCHTYLLVFCERCVGEGPTAVLPTWSVTAISWSSTYLLVFCERCVGEVPTAVLPTSSVTPISWSSVCGSVSVSGALLFCGLLTLRVDMVV